LFPNVWKTKVSDQLCTNKELDKATRDYILKQMYGIDKNRMPSIWERADDRELVARRMVASKD
jgi:hypothetical protein